MPLDIRMNESLTTVDFLELPNEAIAQRLFYSWGDFEELLRLLPGVNRPIASLDISRSGITILASPIRKTDRRLSWEDMTDYIHGTNTTQRAVSHTFRNAAGEYPYYWAFKAALHYNTVIYTIEESSPEILAWDDRVTEFTRWEDAERECQVRENGLRAYLSDHPEEVVV